MRKLILAGLLLSTPAWAAPNSLGAIGDSISTGFDADDSCDTITSCATKIGENRNLSWTTGYDTVANSLRKLFGYSSTVEQQKNGARWSDAPGQAGAIVSAGGANRVSVLLGGNDICRNVDDTLPSLSTISGQIDQTFSALVNAPAGSRPSQVVVASVPNVVNLYNTMVNQQHFLFDTCQGLWNDFSGPTDKAKVCDSSFFLFDWICDLATWLNKVTGWVGTIKNIIVWAVDTFNGKTHFPCGYVLNSSATPAMRSAASSFNTQLNSLLQQKVAQYNGYNGVSFSFDNNSLYNFQFTSKDVSHLDCFHPSKQGQQNVASSVWNGANLGGSQSATNDTSTPAVTGTWTAAHNNDPGQGSSPPPPSYSYQTNSFTTNAPAGKYVWMQSYGYDSVWSGCSYLYGYPCYVGYVKETPSSHGFEVGFYVNGQPDPAEYYDYWRMLVQPVSVRGVASSSIYVGPWN